MSRRELFCPDPLAGFEKMAGFQIFFLLFCLERTNILPSKVASCGYNLLIFLEEYLIVKRT